MEAAPHSQGPSATSIPLSPDLAPVGMIRLRWPDANDRSPTAPHRIASVPLNRIPWHHGALVEVAAAIRLELVTIDVLPEMT